MIVAQQFTAGDRSANKVGQACHRGRPLEQSGGKGNRVAAGAAIDDAIDRALSW